MKFKEDKSSLAYRLRKQIYQAAVGVVGKRRVKFEEVVLEHPAQMEHGDYSTNIALRLHSRRVPSGHSGSELQHRLRGEGVSAPFDLANEIVNAWRSSGLPEWVAKIEIAPPGFINIWLQNEYLISQLSQVLRQGDKFGSTRVLEKKKILLEHTSPNPQTTIMLGHLRNNFLGMSWANILEFQNAKVIKDCVVNDRGVHICKAIWGYLVFGQKRKGLKKEELLEFKKVGDSQIKKLSAKINWQSLLESWLKKKSGWYSPKDLRLKPDHTNLIWYVLGSRAYDLSEKVHQQVEEILLAWEAEDKNVWQIWKQILGWSAKGYEQTYKRIGSLHDWVWRESDYYQQGKEIVKNGLEKGVFRQSEGAVVTNLAKYGLADTVVAKADGTALYITQDLALTRLKCQQFPSDLYIWDIGEEQSLYFRQLFTVCEQLGIAFREKLFHLAYALINFKGGGKMATRKGEVVMADEVLDELHRRALGIIKSSNQELRGKLSPRQLELLAEKVAVGALKYSLLKFSRDTTIYFDIDESLALEGNSGPYLQYTYVRCQSVLAKARHSRSGRMTPARWANALLGGEIAEEELALLRTIYKFPKIIGEAAKNYSPNLICNFLFDLGQKYNLFYNKWPILHPEKDTSEVGLRRRRTSEVSRVRDFRLALTAATAQVIKNGLGLLGIQTPERM